MMVENIYKQRLRPSESRENEDKERTSEMTLQENILETAETADEAVKRINEKCETCYRRSCAGCTWSHDELIRRLWKEKHPSTTVKAKQPGRTNKHTDGRNHNVTTIQALYALLRKKYNSKNISMRGLAKKYFMEIAHKCGVPEEITYVQAAMAYAEKTTLRYKRKTIAEYMLDEYNERW